MDNTMNIIVRSYRNACRIVRQAEDHLIGISEEELNTAILIKERSRASLLLPRVTFIFLMKSIVFSSRMRL